MGIERPPKKKKIIKETQNICLEMVDLTTKGNATRNPDKL
jgi:hypothetical protein